MRGLNRVFGQDGLLDGGGSTVESLEYDQYGKARFSWTGTPGVQSQSSVGNPWTYATGRFDEWTGLLYLRNRYLKVEFGRFATVDPLGGWADAAGMGNPYCYGGNAASTRMDGLGLMSMRGGGGGGGHISMGSGGGSDAGLGLGGGAPEPGMEYNGLGAGGKGSGGSCPKEPASTGGGGREEPSSKDKELAKKILSGEVDVDKLAVSFDWDTVDVGEDVGWNQGNEGYKVGHGYVTIIYDGHAVSFGLYSGGNLPSGKPDNRALPFLNEGSQGDFRQEGRDAQGRSMHERANISVVDSYVSREEFDRLRHYLLRMLAKPGLYDLCGKKNSGNCATSVLSAIREYIDPTDAVAEEFDKWIAGMSDGNPWISPSDVGRSLLSEQGLKVVYDIGLYTSM